MKGIQYECQACKGRMEMVLRESFRPPIKCSWCGEAQLVAKGETRLGDGPSREKVWDLMDFANEAGRKGLDMDQLVNEVMKKEKKGKKR